MIKLWGWLYMKGGNFDLFYYREVIQRDSASRSCSEDIKKIFKLNILHSDFVYGAYTYGLHKALLPHVSQNFVYEMNLRKTQLFTRGTVRFIVVFGRARH